MSRDPGTHAPEEGIEATDENHSTKKTSRKKKSHLKTCIERVHRALEKQPRATSPDAPINGISALRSSREITWSSRQKDQVTGKGKKISVIFLPGNQGKRIEARTSIQPDWPQGLTEGRKTSSVTPSPQGCSWCQEPVLRSSLQPWSAATLLQGQRVNILDSVHQEEN